MDTPISWIKAYVPDLDCTPQEYADKMNIIWFQHGKCHIFR